MLKESNADEGVKKIKRSKIQIPVSLKMFSIQTVAWLSVGTR